MQAVIVLWIILLVVTVLVLPFIVRLLHQVYKSSKHIDNYFGDMLTAGLGIAGNTDKITALDDTISVASGILGVAGDIDNHAEALGNALATRAEAL